MKKHETLYTALISMLQGGEFDNGTRLPTEAQLCAIYGVSRITVRKALGALADKGYIRRRARLGTFAMAAETKRYNVPLILPYNEYINYDIVAGALSAATSADVATPFYNSNNNAAIERDLLSQYLDGGADGIMLYPCSHFENVDLLNALRARRVPLVFLDRAVHGMDFPLITSDNAAGAFKLAEGLIRRGMRVLGYYGVHSNMNFAEAERFRGFCLALAENRVPLRRELIYTLPDSVAHSILYARELTRDIYDVGIDVAKRFANDALRQKSALVCTNDYLALSVLKASKAVGTDFIVTGYDNLGFARDNSLTTAEQNFYEIGRTALEIIIQMIAEQSVTPLTLIPTRVIFR